MVCYRVRLSCPEVEEIPVPNDEGEGFEDEVQQGRRLLAEQGICVGLVDEAGMRFRYRMGISGPYAGKS
jgi:hypothetical protein